MLTSLINEPNGKFYKYHNFFQLIPVKYDLFYSLLRIFICGILSGFILGICLNIGSSTGGIDIIAKYMSIYKKKDISLCIFILNFSISIISVFFICFFNKKIDLIPIFLTFMKLFINSLVIYLVL
ncbi:MAG: YitT family protein, partial [Candidatus Phytoplasma stylosanthis]|nr:YitT family protein [Candidatus Phytoplasma stylosanthis]